MKSGRREPLAGVRASHPAWGAWIEICKSDVFDFGGSSRTPHGVRGLKSARRVGSRSRNLSHPAWGAWIEIVHLWPVAGISMMWHPAWGAWIEIVSAEWSAFCIRSHPAWGAWIEIVLNPPKWIRCSRRTPHGVRGLKSSRRRATRRECRSHPAWGAWIEIEAACRAMASAAVAPPTGCVD